MRLPVNPVSSSLPLPLRFALPLLYRCLYLHLITILNIRLIRLQSNPLSSTEPTSGHPFVVIPPPFINKSPVRVEAPGGLMLSY